MADKTEQAIRKALSRRGSSGDSTALDVIAGLLDERPIGNRVVMAHDLPMPADEIARHMQAIAENGDWYFVRDPALQINELLSRGDLTIFRDDDGRVRVHMLVAPVIKAEGDSVEEALLNLWQKTSEA